MIPLFIGHDAERAFYETAREEFQDALERAIAGLPTDVQATGEVFTGDVVEVLAELGEDEVDVLFCGSRRYGPLRRVLLGGVSPAGPAGAPPADRRAPGGLSRPTPPTMTVS